MELVVVKLHQHRLVGVVAVLPYDGQVDDGLVVGIGLRAAVDGADRDARAPSRPACAPEDDLCPARALLRTAENVRDCHLLLLIILTRKQAI
eukprot:scaffold74617_cov31-Prasinocladus_malaysianus.AAC.1